MKKTLFLLLAHGLFFVVFFTVNHRHFDPAGYAAYSAVAALVQTAGARAKTPSTTKAEDALFAVYLLLLLLGAAPSPFGGLAPDDSGGSRFAWSAGLAAGFMLLLFVIGRPAGKKVS